MPQPLRSFETVYGDLLLALWEEFENLLEAHYGSGRRDRTGSERLRMKLGDVKGRLAALLAQGNTVLETGTDSDRTPAIREFGHELLRLIDAQLGDDDFDLSCGVTLVRAQNRILVEAQRLALMR